MVHRSQQVLEFGEIYDCVALSQFLVPVKICLKTMQLALYQIQFMHESTSEVYDPRDKKTGRPFRFPDTQDLAEHYTSKVVPAKEALAAQFLALNRVKQGMFGQSDMNSADKEERRQQLCEIHGELLMLEQELEVQSSVAATASMLQLAVMWKNRWNLQTFPPNYLWELAMSRQRDKDGEELQVTGAGRTDFMAIDWMETARHFEKWRRKKGDSDGDGIITSHDHMKKREGLLERILGSDSKSDSGSKIFQRQEKRFAELEPLIDFLAMLRQALELHSRIMAARGIKYWDGPKGGSPPSDTVYRKFQGMIKDFNKTGKALQAEMEGFPVEIEQGFTEPNESAAETIRIQVPARTHARTHTDPPPRAN